MKKNDLKNKDSNELLSSLAGLKSRLLQLSFERVEKRLKDSSQISKTKKEIAQTLTALRLAKKQ